jgi:5-formyltetrahydrofolate cyclo-ligase
MDAKALLRQRVVAARAARSAADRRAAALALRRELPRAAATARVVAGYVPVGTEPPILDGLVALAAAGTVVLLPLVAADGLQWAPFAGVDRLRRGPFGLLEPDVAVAGTRALDEVELAFVPALAVDGAGRRLGRGGGYYDRALAGTAVRAVAVVYDDEVLDEVPDEPHDVRVAGVLTPGQGLRWCPPDR